MLAPTVISAAIEGAAEARTEITVNKRTNLYYWRFNPPERVNRELALNSIEDNKGYKVRRTPPGFYDKDRLEDFIQTINKDIEW